MIDSKMYVKLRLDIREHVQMGQLKYPDEYALFTYLLVLADQRCGIVFNISAEFLGMGNKKEVRKINTCLKSLEKKGYIKRYFHIGRVKSYLILIDKFITVHGFKTSINGSNFTNFNDIYSNELCVFTDLKEILNGSLNVFKPILNGSFLVAIKHIKQFKHIKEVKHIKDNTVSAKPKKQKVLSQLSNDFVVTDSHREFSTKNKFNSPDSLINAFKDYHFSKGSKFKDWDRAFQTWIRNDTEKFNNKNQPVQFGYTEAQMKEYVDGYE